MTEREQAKTLLADAINADTASVPDDARLGFLEQWDSLAHLRLILALETRIGRALDPDEIVRIGSLDDVIAVLNQKSPG
jgi:acyl carrier protein